MIPKSGSIDRRQFLTWAGVAALGLLAGSRLYADPPGDSAGRFLFVEAEGFTDRGGWELDQQSMDQMGSPYLLAHGLGVPVRDAVTQVTFPGAGRYRVWVRTKDWVAPWNAPGTPGRFQLLIDGQALPETFGTKGAAWHWHDGGTVTLGAEAELALHDLTGFEGRCEAILFCADLAFEPSNEVAALTAFRRRLLGLPDAPEDGGSYDLLVVGGGLAGTCAALAAARGGLRVALVQDRPVLGGNGSSEVRVWPQGSIQQEPFPHLGDMVAELIPADEQRGMNGAAAPLFNDTRKLAVVDAEPRLTVLLEHRLMTVDAVDQHIRSVVVQSTVSARQQRLHARLFADCSGDAKMGYLAGADHEYELDKPLMGSSNLFSVLDAADPQQVLACECKDKAALAMATAEGRVAQPFPRCPWALDLTNKPFPGRGKFGNGRDNLSKFERQWYWESGFDKNPIADIELIRDHNFRAMYGAWDALKNVDGLYPNHRLGWSAFIAGKRESRRLLGDVVLDGKHFMDGLAWDDAAFPCSWHIDLHFPNKRYAEGFAGNEFVSDFTRGKDYRYQGIYWAPYRCLYSRNVSNLFMAGRDISVTKSGLGAVRVMRTCGMMGEVVGKAAAICIRHGTEPRAVYHQHLAELQAALREPGAARVE
ncbi:MAG: FAD-dependent oxidoreductase [Planctomycetota bacterium]|jgi:hypothetical protein|nr:FAD-dependent oxidoreductase [Planctomycetota bacterium]